MKVKRDKVTSIKVRLRRNLLFYFITRGPRS